LLSMAGLGFFLAEGKLNSDLGQLIQPSDENAWYEANEQYKRSFPMYLQTAILVVRGSDQAITRHATKTIATALTNSQHFERVFAPS
ncbi:MAG: hypothetical protein ACPG4A_02970, partial [Pseudomonadales bacterium]